MMHVLTLTHAEQCNGPYFGTVTDKKGKKSQYHTSGWFNCNNVDQSALEAKVSNEGKKLERWQRISDKCAHIQCPTHVKSLVAPKLTMSFEVAISC